MTLTFQGLRIANTARNKEWDPFGEITTPFRGNEMAGELGEAVEAMLKVMQAAAAGGRACNVLKKIERERIGLRGSRATVEDLASELADVIICLDLIAMDFGIDLSWAVREKFNAASDKHGLRTRIPNREGF